ncbi:MAG: hypothetical protein PHS49_00380 [Candidatus Gracilibacteria bacterium]|nr:hypothetical protein [Candidatus Gracilibacteria bacterium]
MINKSFLKKITLKKVSIFILLIFIISEIINISTDIHNFKQLEKVKIIMKDKYTENKQFINLKEFNDIYKTDIKPIKNCYYVSYNSSEKNVKYNFSFKLYSTYFRIIYSNEYYIYPKYNLPVHNFCGGGSKCDDINYEYFLETISNPCRD